MGNKMGANCGSQLPFIKKIKTRNHNYIYEVNSNNLIRVNQIIYDLIDGFGKSSPDSLVDKFKHRYNPADILRYYESIKKVKDEQNLFSANRPVINSGFRSEEDIKYILDSNLNQIILELTARCNHRCKYCPFSGRYTHKRQHEERDMTLDIAKKSVEYFIARTNTNKKEMKPAITFYGGEPLLRFDLIKEIVELTKRSGVSNEYRFSLTTNGTLLTDEVIKYFVENDISILVSLDGPKKIHDLYRVFSNGQGTFDAIQKNLKRIKKCNPEYFENNISFNAVVTPPYDFDSIIQFFYRRTFFKPFKDKIRVNFVDAYHTSFFRDFNLERENTLLNTELNRLLNRYKKALIDGSHEKLTIERQLFLDNFYTIAMRPIAPLEKKYPPIGTCIPGQRRLFVDTVGKFFMCEKVGSNYEIGNADKGFNYQVIYDFYLEYDDFFQDCKYCWALRLCKKCFNSIRKGADFDDQRKKEMCKKKLKVIEDNLIIYCEILERKPDAFKVYESIEMS